jgi:hypothetical protein
VLGVLLLADWHSLTVRWPWPLPPLPANIVGAWFCTLAAGLLWFAARERDWARARIALVPMMVPVVLDLVAAARLRHGFAGNVATGIYLAGLGLVLVALAGVAVIEERRLHSVPAAAAMA